MTRPYDAVVVGLGALGAAVLNRLARDGRRVLGLDVHPPPHTRGATHGDTRLIRRAYFEDPRYIPLLGRAEAAWAALAERCGRDLYRRVGLLVWSGAGDRLDAMLANGAAHGVPLEALGAREAARRYPALHLPATGRAVLEPGAGYLLVEASQEALLDEARERGAAVRAPTRVRGWTRVEGGFEVDVGGETVAAARVVVCAGAWLERLIPDLPFEVALWRAPQVWFRADGDAHRDPALPCFGFETEAAFFYGFPATERRGVKVAAYDPALRLDDPDLLPELEPDPRELDPLREVVARFLPGLSGEVEATEMCMYTCSPDEDFLLAEHPARPGVFLLGAGSGHAYKFAPALADALAAAAFGDGPPEDCAFLGWRAGG